MSAVTALASDWASAWPVWVSRVYRQQTHHQPAVHRQPAEPGRRRGVHVALANLGHGADTDGEATHQRDQEIGHRC